MPDHPTCQAKKVVARAVLPSFPIALLVVFAFRVSLVGRRLLKPEL
jgi:hypothetical protein